MESPRASIADMLTASARYYGNRIAMSDDQRSISFRTWIDQAAQLAHVLRADGVSAGSQVGLALREGIDTMVAMVALWMLDAVAVTMDFRSRVDERNRLALAFDMNAILEDRSLPGASYNGMVLRDCVSRSANRPVTPPLETLGSRHAAIIALTSGTTGEALGLVISHQTLALRCYAFGIDAPIPRATRYLNPLPLSFSASRNYTLGHLIRGSEVIFHPPTFGAGELIEKINSLDIGFSLLVPATLRELLDVVGEPLTPALPKMNQLMVGGAETPADHKLRAARYLTPSFTTVIASASAGTIAILTGDDLLARPETEGRVLSITRAEIVDPEDRVLPPGELGLLRIRAVGTIDGIYKDRERTTGDKIRGGWIFTGDIGSIDREGFLTIHGRSSDMIIRGGANVFPAEVEDFISQLQGVLEVAVTGFADPKLGEEIAAFVVAPGVSEAMLFAHTRATLPPDKRPRRFIFMDALPRNNNGKVLKRELRGRLESDGERST